MILGDEDALAKIAISYQQNTKKEDAVCEKHGCRYITVLKTGLTVCPDCHREELDNQNALHVQKQYERELENKRLYYLKKLSIMDDELENASLTILGLIRLNTKRCFIGQRQWLTIGLVVVRETSS